MSDEKNKKPPEQLVSILQDLGVGQTISELTKASDLYASSVRLPTHRMDSILNSPSILQSLRIAEMAELASRSIRLPTHLTDSFLNAQSIAQSFRTESMAEFTARQTAFLRPLEGLTPSILSSDVQLAAQRVLANSFRLPDLGEIARFSGISFRKDGFAKAILDSNDFFADLRVKMEGMRSPWLSAENAMASVRAFAEIQAVGSWVNSGNPFAVSVCSSLRTELGDWRDVETVAPDLLEDHSSRTALYVSRGFNSNLTNFTAQAFDETLEIAAISEASNENFGADGVDEQGLIRNQRAFAILMRFEIEIRRFISECMYAQYGSDWMKHKVPGDILESWRNKAESAKRAGGAELELIAYADFTDYQKIIERKDNWATVFKSVFHRQENIRESFQRLFPVRIATMHARIITLDDELYLMSETRRVLNAVRKVIQPKG